MDVASAQRARVPTEVVVIRFPVPLLRRPHRAAARAAGPSWHRGIAFVATVALLALTLGFPASADAGTVRYLSTKGSDSNPGTASRPWGTLYASLAKLKPGDKLYIRGGTYAWSGIHWTGLAGTSTRPILISNYPGESPVFAGTGAPADWLNFDGNAAWVTVRGLTVKGGETVTSTKGSSLIGFTDNANHITLDRMKLYGDPTWALDQHLVYVADDSVNDITIKNSLLDGRGCICSGLVSLFHDPNAARVTLTYNTFRNADQAVLVWANASAVRIVANTFSNTRIAVRHHNSGGTYVSRNRGHSVRIGVFADSRANLTTSGNSW